MILSHQIRLAPTKAQEEYFRCACGTARFTYNWALAEWKRLYGAGEKPSGWGLKKQFNAIRREEFPWTYDVHRDCTGRSFDDLQNAYKHFFRRLKLGQNPGYPKFKKKGSGDSFYITNYLLRLNNKRVRIPVLGWVQMREPLRYEGKVMGATVKRVANRWMLSIRVDVGDYNRPRISDKIVGVDLGAKTLATLSTGEKIEGPKALRKSLKRLKRLSRWHSRKKPGSANRKKAAQKLARLHCRVADIRSEALNVLTTRLCRENQVVGIEDLDVEGMLRNRYLALSISDMGFGEFRRQMAYKSKIYDTELRIADRYFPSSKTCSVCGNIKKDLKLSDRIFKCNNCGVSLDRDLNAALNLRNLPAVSREVTPVEIKALAETRKRVSETSVMEAGTCVSEYLNSFVG